MKKYKFFLFASFMFMLVINASSCKKEDKTPEVIDDEKKELLVKDWKMSKYEMNGKDVTQDIKDLIGGDVFYTFKYDNSYNASIEGGQSIVKGRWEFTNAKETITLTSDAGIGKDFWTIVKLNNDNLWIKFTDDNGLNEVQFVKK